MGDWEDQDDAFFGGGRGLTQQLRELGGVAAAMVGEVVPPRRTEERLRAAGTLAAPAPRVRGHVLGEADSEASEEYTDFDFGPDPAVESILLEEGGLGQADPEAGVPEVWVRPRQMEYYEGEWLVEGRRRGWSFQTDNGVAWEVFRGSPKAEDVKQGSLGDCWFVSAVACLAEFQGGRLIRRLFQPQKRRGRHEVSLFIGGLERRVVLDDRLPATLGRRNEGVLQVTRSPCRLVYCVTARRQLFASLLEKAYAKHCGSYEALKGGQASEAFEVLTGWPVVSVNFDPENGDTSEALDDDLLWAQLVSSKDRNFLMALSSRSEEFVQGAGLKPAHCYSILDLQVVGDAPHFHRLVKIRNPHGAGEWSGDWSRASPLWTRELRSRLHYRSGVEDGNDGVFYMRFADVRQYFHQCTVCQIRAPCDGWMQCRGALSVSSAGATALEVEVFETSPVVITVSQEPDRVERTSAVKVDFQFVVLGLGDARPDTSRLDDLHARSRFRTAFSIASDEIILRTGRYLVVPIAPQAQSPELLEMMPNVRLGVPLGYCVTSAKPILTTEVPLTPVQVAKAVRAFVRSPVRPGAGPSERHDAREESTHLPARMYTFREHGNLYQWVENPSRHTLLRVQTTVTERSDQIFLGSPPTLRNMILKETDADIFEAAIPPGKGMLLFAAIITDRLRPSSFGFRQQLSGLPAVIPYLTRQSVAAPEEDELIDPGVYSLIDL